jgi:prevent-host-death family protein
MKTDKKDRSRHEREWQLQEAKKCFSRLVESARHDGPQTITLRGKPAVVVVSFEQFKKLTQPRTTLSQFFGQSPLHGMKLDLRRND